MNKKSQAEVLEIINAFEVLIAVLLAVYLIWAATSYSNVTDFNKRYLEKDLKLLANTVVASPGDIKLKYPISEQYEITIQDKVLVNKTVKIIPQDIFNKKSALVFEKKQGKISVSRT